MVTGLLITHLVHFQCYGHSCYTVLFSSDVKKEEAGWIPPRATFFLRVFLAGLVEPEGLAMRPTCPAHCRASFPEVSCIQPGCPHSPWVFLSPPLGPSALTLARPWWWQDTIIPRAMSPEQTFDCTHFSSIMSMVTA